MWLRLSAYEDVKEKVLSLKILLACIGTYICSIKNFEKKISEVGRKTKFMKSPSQIILVLVDRGTDIDKVINCLNHNVFGSGIVVLTKVL